MEAVRSWTTPRNLTEVRSFVGLCSYYRRFIAGFADVAAPLHALTRKNARFIWGSEQDEAFNNLKEKLISAPILGMSRDEGTYYLDTDASNTGLGAVLSQEQDGKEVVLAYASRTLAKTRDELWSDSSRITSGCVWTKSLSTVLARQKVCNMNRPFGTTVTSKNARADRSTSSLAVFHWAVRFRHQTSSRIATSKCRCFVEKTFDWRKWWWHYWCDKSASS